MIRCSQRHPARHAESGLDPLTTSSAEAIRNNADEAVGWKDHDCPLFDSEVPISDDARAVRWELIPVNPAIGDWDAVVFDLNAEIHPDCPVKALLRADDISENGSIVGVADFQMLPDPPTREAFLLTLTSLEPCPEDVNKDGVIDDQDLDIVLGFIASYTGTGRPPCPPGRMCWEDVNFDCWVDDFDVRAIMEKLNSVCGGSSSATQMPGIMIDVWLTAGGYDGIEAGAITAAPVGDALAAPTAAEEFVALMALIE
jgi:hypothetical protein